MKKLKIIICHLILLLVFASCIKNNRYDDHLNVGFDVDDTLLFSTPAFEKGFSSRYKPFSEGFWIHVNAADRDCSIAKQKAASLVEMHMLRGDEVFVITAREPYGSEALKEYLSEKFSIKKDNIYFEPDGKSQRMKSLELDIFYGDSDSDIIDAMAAGAKAYRILRSTASSYRKKYNPGKFGEEIIDNSVD